MRRELYQAECKRIASEQTALLDEARQRIMSGASLSRLEQSGMLHALQVLVENAIGKSKHLLKLAGVSVPVSAYDAFASLERHGDITLQELQQWNSALGMGNRIVHDYMNIDMGVIYGLVSNDHYRFIAAFCANRCRQCPNEGLLMWPILTGLELLCAQAGVAVGCGVSNKITDTELLI